MTCGLFLVTLFLLFFKCIPLYPIISYYYWFFYCSNIGLQLCINKEVFVIYAAKLLQSCPTLCNPIDGSPPGSPIPGIFQARTLEWVAVSFSNAWKWKVKVKSLSRVRLVVTPWTAAYQAPPSMGFSRQEYWSGVPLPSLLFIVQFFFSKPINYIVI